MEKKKFRIVVDRSRCVGFGTCVDVAPSIFRFDDEGKATAPPEGEFLPQRLFDAAKACPALAILVSDADKGAAIYPEN
jgi:ferredoxin